MKTLLKVLAIMSLGLMAGAAVLIALPILLLIILIRIIGGAASKIH